MIPFRLLSMGSWATPYKPGREDPYFWAIILILGGIFTFILGLADWRLGFWLKEDDVRLLNIVGGLIAILWGITIIYLNH